MDDLLLMLNVIQGHDRDDPLSSPAAPDRFATLPQVDLNTLSVGYSGDFGGAPVDPAIRETFRARIEALRPHVKECRAANLDLGQMDRVFDILRAESFVAGFAEALKTAPEDFGGHIAQNVAMGQAMSLADRSWAHAEQTRILRNFNKVMDQFDIILLPTAPVSPFSWRQFHPTEIDGQAMVVYYRWLALMYRGSLTGGPALTLPCGRDPQGMPFGLQMLGPLRGDAPLLATAKQWKPCLPVRTTPPARAPIWRPWRRRMLTCAKS
jgi:Asp-tRNAAsn/Glu-tRNAGln amidotransferase A subunit and related amidases